ncbi:MAG TPA: hypothetical protein VNE39_05520 [Planctomycetota bacterium]|nr:hypothetical protein [Planctomycetota bacterium]
MERCLSICALVVTASFFGACSSDDPSPVSESEPSLTQRPEQPLEEKEPISASFQEFAVDRGYNPRAHHQVLRYFRKLWAGESRDPAFEAKSLRRHLDFRLLNLAELIVAMCSEIDLSVGDAIEFLSISTSSEPLPEAILTQRVATMAASSEEERARRLLTEADTKSLAVSPIHDQFDRVEFLVKFCAAIEGWCRKDKPSRFPSLAVEDPTAPPHMRKSHPDDIRVYRARRKALGKPWEENTATAVSRYIAYELKREFNRDLAIDKIVPTAKFSADLGLDEVDIIGLFMGLEDHYDGRFALDAIEEDDLNNATTVGDLIRAIDRQLRSGNSHQEQ